MFYKSLILYFHLSSFMPRGTGLECIRLGSRAVGTVALWLSLGAGTALTESRAILSESALAFSFSSSTMSRCILTSEGEKQSQILQSEGEKAATINRAEAQKQQIGRASCRERV